MKITREQFIRGVAAIQAHRDMMQEVEAVLLRYGENGGEVGVPFGREVMEELLLQMEERCNDPHGEIGSFIWSVIAEKKPIRARWDGIEYHISTPEDLWEFWRVVGEGPFQPDGRPMPEPAQVLHLATHRGRTIQGDAL